MREREIDGMENRNRKKVADEDSNTTEGILRFEYAFERSDIQAEKLM